MSAAPSASPTAEPASRKAHEQLVFVTVTLVGFVVMYLYAKTYAHAVNMANRMNGLLPYLEEERKRRRKEGKAPGG